MPSASDELLRLETFLAPQVESLKSLGLSLSLRVHTGLSMFTLAPSLLSTLLHTDPRLARHPQACVSQLQPGFSWQTAEAGRSEPWVCSPAFLFPLLIRPPGAWL